MKTKEVHIRISEKRFNKLKNHALLKEKTVTQMIEDYIDRLPSSGLTTPYPHLMSTLFALASRREGGDFRDTLNSDIQQ
jgi:hypothetical protein